MSPSLESSGLVNTRSHSVLHCIVLYSPEPGPSRVFPVCVVCPVIVSERLLPPVHSSATAVFARCEQSLVLCC